MVVSILRSVEIFRQLASMKRGRTNKETVMTENDCVMSPEGFAMSPEGLVMSPKGFVMSPDAWGTSQYTRKKTLINA